MTTAIAEESVVEPQPSSPPRWTSSSSGSGIFRSHAFSLTRRSRRQPKPIWSKRHVSTTNSCELVDGVLVEKGDGIR